MSACITLPSLLVDDFTDSIVPRHRGEPQAARTFLLEDFTDLRGPLLPGAPVEVAAAPAPATSMGELSPSDQTEVSGTAPEQTTALDTVEVPGPQVLFRPCANPDPTTSGPCSEDFPKTYPCYDPNGCADNLLAARLEAHRSWIAEQGFSAWQIPDQWFGYPWTRQGYTYNWNAEAETLVGTSEYVIPGGMMIKVCKRLPATEFCQSSLSEIEALCDD